MSGIGAAVGENVGENTGSSGSTTFLAVPTNFSIDSVTSTTATVSWTAPAKGGAVEYHVKDNTGILATIAYGATGTTVTDLLSETAYTMWVVTSNGIDESNASNTDFATTPPQGGSYTHYVSPTGTGTWAQATSIGTPTDIDTAFASATAGDVVGFLGGTYQTPPANRVSYQGYWQPSFSGTLGNPITFMAYEDEIPILSMDINDEVYLGVNPNIAQVLATGTQEYVTFDGFKCVALDDKTAGIFLGEGTPVSKKRGIICQNCEVQCGTKAIPQRDNFDAVRIEDCDGAVFTKNKIKDLVGAPPYPHHNVAALKLYDNINVIVEHNEITNCNEGIVAKRDFEDGFIRYNWVDDCVEGIHVLVTNFGNGTNSGTEIYHNLITNSGYIAIDYNADSGVTKSAEDIQVYNNTIYDGGTGWGIFLDECPTADVYNNIIHGNTDQLATSTDTTLTTCDHNQFGTGAFDIEWDYPGTHYNSLAAWQSSGRLIGGGNPGSGSLASDPKFVNTSGSLNQIADFALDTGSPCIGAGRSSVDMGANIALVGIQ